MLAEIAETTQRLVHDQYELLNDEIIPALRDRIRGLAEAFPLYPELAAPSL